MLDLTHPQTQHSPRFTIISAIRMKTKTIPNATLCTFREENQVSKLLRYASIQMTERYTHLAPHHLHDAIANLGFSARFQHTEKPKRQRSTSMT